MIEKDAKKSNGFLEEIMMKQWEYKVVTIATNAVLTAKQYEKAGRLGDGTACGRFLFLQKGKERLILAEKTFLL